MKFTYPDRRRRIASISLRPCGRMTVAVSSRYGYDSRSEVVARMGTLHSTEVCTVELAWENKSMYLVAVRSNPITTVNEILTSTAFGERRDHDVHGLDLFVEVNSVLNKKRKENGSGLLDVRS